MADEQQELAVRLQPEFVDVADVDLRIGAHGVFNVIIDICFFQSEPRIFSMPFATDDAIKCSRA